MTQQFHDNGFPVSTLHDSIILSYHADFEKKELVMKTHYVGGGAEWWEDVIFTDCLSHLFRGADPIQNMICSINEVSIELFIKHERDLIVQEGFVQWPAPCRTIEALLDYIHRNKYKVYSIESVIGLGGWVIAKNMEIVQVDK